MASSTVTGADSFAEAIAKSGLVSAEVLANIRQAAAAGPDAKSLARDLVKGGTLTRWQAAQLLHGFHTLVVGKYRLLDQLGSGETGRVYLAEHAQMNRRHALKILSRRQTSKPDVLKRFLAEAQRVCALDHRNLSHVYDVNQDGDKYYLVMEYVEGEDLKKRVESAGPLPAGKAVELVLQAIDGLIHAHDKQVVHGDLKPTNLIVDATGTLKVTDIGQARLVEAPANSAADETTEAAALSAALYRAPELREGKQAADVQSDVYSLGNILCFVLTGKAAKDDADARRLLGAAKGVQPELADLCTKMLAVQPEQRPSELSAVQASLVKLVKGDAGKPAVPPMPKAKKPPVAKAIVFEEEPEAVVSADEDKPAEDNPLAGLSVQPPRSRGTKPAVKPAAASAAPAAAEPVTPAPGKVKSRGPAPAKSSKGPMIVVAALGGGILLLGGIALAVFFGLGQGSGEVKDTKAVAAAKTNAKSAAETAAENEKAIEAAMAAIGETNPAPPPAEANPNPAAVAAPANTTPPAPTAPAPPTTTPMPATTAAEAAEPAKPADPAPTPEPPPAEPANPDPKPETKPEPVKPDPKPALKEPPKAEPAQPAPEKPTAAAATAEAFKGLPTTVTLPKLVPGTADPPPDALVPLVIGPCSPDATAQLKGGAGAMRGGKTTFEMVEGKDDQSLGKWDVVMSVNKVPLTIAQFSVQNKQLAFQWTADGAKHESSPYLANCKLVLSVGADQHEIALREPLQGEPLLVEFEKPGSTVKWTIEHLPDPRKIVVEISRLGDAFPAHKFDPEPTMTGQSADTLVWTGADPENALLGMKFESSQTAKVVQVKGTAQFKQGNSAKPLLPRTIKTMEKEIDQTRLGLVNSEKLLTNQAGGNDAQKKQRADALKAVKMQQDEVNAQGEQFNQFQQLVAELKGKSEVHFRVYYLADEGTQVDLVVPAAAPPPKEKKAETKKK